MEGLEELKGLLKEVIGDTKAKEDEAKIREERMKTIETLSAENKTKLEKIE